MTVAAPIILHYALPGNSCDIQFTWCLHKASPGCSRQPRRGNLAPWGPVTWSAHLIGTHPGAATAAFGTVQLLLGIAWRPTVRAALAASNLAAIATPGTS